MKALMTCCCMVFLLAQGTACVKAVQVSGFTLQGNDWKRAEESLLRQAAFDMSCEEELTLTVLDIQRVMDPLLPGDRANAVGVQGCGKQMRFVRAPTGQWLANTAK